MDKVSIIVSGLEYKIKKLVDLHTTTFKENKKLKEEITSAKRIIEDQQNNIKKLEEKINVQKIAQTLESEKDTQQTKQKINELVREIDKCIDILNK